MRYGFLRFPRRFITTTCAPFVLLCLVCVLGVDGAEPSVEQMQAAIPTSRGLIVHVGAESGELAAGLAKRDPVVVLAVTKDAATETRVRDALVAAGVHGQATAATLTDGRLPLIDHVAASIVADLDVLPVAEGEILRVLQPEGRAWIRSEGKWRTVTKPRPEQMDDWGQYHRDAAMSDVSKDLLVGPAHGLQWVSGPQTNQTEGFRIAGNVALQQAGPDAAGRAEWLIARDAFSGLPLWTRKDLVPASRYALMLDRKRVYIYPKQLPGHERVAPYIIALDVKTGQTVLEYTEGIRFDLPDEMPADRNKANAIVEDLRRRSEDFMARLTEDGLLLQAADRQLVVLRAEDGKRLWSVEADEGLVWYYPVVSGGVVHVIEGRKVRSPSYTHWPTPDVARVRTLRMSDGKELWRYDWPKDRESIAAHNMVRGEGKLAMLVRQPAVGRGQVKALVINASDGSEVYFDTNAVFDGQMGAGHSGGRVLAIGDRLWHTTITVIRGSISLTNPGDSETWDTTHRGHARPVGCTSFRATPNWILGSLTAYALDGDKELQHTDVARTVCDVGAFPANGMNYLMPNHCFCQPYIPGSTVFHSRPFAGEQEITRLEKGTASPAPAREGEGWPTFLRNAARTNWISEPVPADVKQAWSVKLNDDGPPEQLRHIWDGHWYAQGPVTGASVAEGVAVVARSHRQQVVALDPSTGKELWRQTVDGRIDSAPTIHNGLVLAGTRNGWLYALNRDTGELVWRFFAAPRRDRLVADGQLESLWPLFGTVSVGEQGIVAIAGRHTDTDGGLWWWQLDPMTGKVLHRGRIGADQLKDKTGGGGAGGQRPTGANSTPVVNGDLVLLPAMMFKLTDGRMEPWSPEVEVDRSERGGWMRRFAVNAIVPGNQGLLNRIEQVSGYKMNAYALTMSRMYATQGDHFVMVGGPTTFNHRGGQSNSQLRYLRKLPDVEHYKEANPKDPKQIYSKMRGNEVLWEHPALNLVRGDGLRSMAVAGDVVLSGMTVSNRDRWRERGEMPHRLQIHTLADGELREEHPLPALPILGGVSSDDGRVFVVTEDGSVTCFGQAKQ